MDRSASDPLKYCQLVDEPNWQPLHCEPGLMPAPSTAYGPGRLTLVVPPATLVPSRYRASPGTSTAWCQAPLSTAAGEDSALAVYELPVPSEKAMLAAPSR